MFKNPRRILILLAFVILSSLPFAAQAQLYGVSIEGEFDDT